MQAIISPLFTILIYGFAAYGLYHVGLDLGAWHALALH